jgi:hypothetical protein
VIRAAASSLRPVAVWLWDRCDLPHVSLLAVLAWTSHAHWLLAGTLGAPDELRWLLPVAIDVYVLAALAQRRDLVWALSLDGLAVAGAHAVHLGQRTTWWAEHVDRAGGDFQWVIPALGAAWGVILVLVMWRVHVVAPTKKARRVTERVKQQVSALQPVSTEPVPGVSTRPVLVGSSGHVSRSTPVRDDRAERVKAARAAGLTWTATAAQVGVSVSTAKRLDKEVAA